MDWISQCIDKVIQSQIWRFVTTHFYWVDWLTLFFLIWGILYGIRQGLLRTLAGILETFLIAYVTFTFHDKAALKLHVYLPFLSSKVLPTFGFLVIAIPVTLIVAFLDSKLSQIFKTTLAPPIRLIGGMAAGAFWGLFLWSFISQALIAIPARAVQRSYEKGISISGPLIKNLADDLYGKVKR